MTLPRLSSHICLHLTNDDTRRDNHRLIHLCQGRSDHATQDNQIRPMHSLRNIFIANQMCCDSHLVSFSPYLVSNHVVDRLIRHTNCRTPLDNSPFRKSESTYHKTRHTTHPLDGKCRSNPIICFNIKKPHTVLHPFVINRQHPSGYRPLKSGINGSPLSSMGRLP